MTPGLALTLGVLLATASGLALVALATGTAAATLQEWLGRLALGAMVGLGVSSLVTFVWLFLAGGIGPRYAWADALACLAVTCGLLLHERTRAGLGLGTVDRRELALTALLLVAAALAVWRFAVAADATPHGEWDAWEVWNYRARHLFRAGADWRAAFAPGIKSAEYPLLLPLASVRLFGYAGESTAAPAVVAGVFTIGSGLVVAGLVGALAGCIAGATAGLLLFGTSGFQWWGAQQYGDVPLAAFVAGAGGILLLAGRAEGAQRRSLLALAGLLLGLAGWTKTEGVVVALLALVVFVAAAARRAGRAAALSTLRGIALGAALPALAWIVQHVWLARELAPVLTEDQTAPLSKLVDPSRWSMVLRELSTRLPGRDVGLLVVMLVIALLQGQRPRQLVRSPALWLALSMVVVDAVVFVLTPLDLHFHLLTAAERLLLQPWPLLLLAVFAAGEAPERLEAAAGSRDPSDGLR